MSKNFQIPVEPVDSVSNLLERVAERYKGGNAVLFRGQHSIEWDLTPRIARTSFRARYMGYPLETEQNMLSEFERLAVPFWTGRDMSSPWDRLALAQHHGLPTRLLDWSASPLVALWFAVEMPSVKGSDAVVWAFEVEESDIANRNADPFTLANTQIFRPRHHDPRIVAQSGWFTVHKFLENKKRFSLLNGIETKKKGLRKFIVSGEKFAEIRHDLARCNVNRATLFPDLAGLCGQLQWQFSSPPDEDDYDIASFLG